MMGLNRLRTFWRSVRRPLYESLGSDRYSHLALNDLDHKLKAYLNFENGLFIEAGGNDGLSQSNTYWFERFRGWQGMLIEAVPDQAQLCRRNRPNAKVINAALVADETTRSVKIKAARLMAFIPGTGSMEEDEARLKSAIDVQQLKNAPEIRVPAVTLASILASETTGRPVDFFSLDVEGYEIPVLQGMNVDRHRPKFILVETTDISRVLETLKGHYRFVNQMSHHDYLLQTDSPA